MATLPSGTVTLLFTDIEGSTRLLQELGQERFNDALKEHRRALRKAFQAHEGVELRTEGDSFFAAFASAREAVEAAAQAQRELAAGPLRVRIGLHTGEPLAVEHEDGYVGADVHRAARICAAGHGGQVLLSRATRDLLAESIELRDLGEHRLKDLAEPVRIYQLGQGRFPPLRSLSNSNLPTPATPLIGRVRELAEMTALLSGDGVRLLTLTGPGGTGKTRLAIQVAAELLDEHTDGVFWVPLASVTDPALVVPSVARTIGAKDDLPGYIEEKRMLLLLDNLEQLLGAAALLAEWLRACPNLKLLVTSRAPLRIGGEQEYEVPTLPEADAIDLFVARAQAVRTAFTPDDDVAEICRRLDGLPLALELAAVRTKLLSPREILELLGQSLDLLTSGQRDVPERQRTLRATIAWSHELLSETEKALFAELAVFASSFDLAAAVEVCGADPDTLGALVDQSLVRRTAEGRFFMLETIREFAQELLDARPDADELRRRHAERLLALGTRAASLWWRTDDPVLLSSLTAEHANVRAAMRWALAADPELAGRLAAIMQRYWFVHGEIEEGRLWSDAALERLLETEPKLRARVLVGASEFARFQHDYPRAIELKEQAIALFRELGHDRCLAATLKDLGETVALQGGWARAQRLIDESLAMRRASGDKDDLAHSFAGRGELALARGDWVRAAEDLGEALELYREVGDDWGMAALSHSLGEVARRRGDADSAINWYIAALEIAIRLGAQHLVSECVEGFAAVAAARGDWPRAARLAGAAGGIRERAGATVAYPEQHERLVAGLRSALSEQELSATWAEGRSLANDESVAYARATTAASRGGPAAELMFETRGVGSSPQNSAGR
jgi:predicted ATPase/class 3 adenylate cyclase